MNKVILLGRLTRDPEMKTTQNDIAMCRFCIAVDRRYDREKTDFINCIAWRSSAETVLKYFKKGDMIGVIGALQNNNYADSEGTKRQNTVVNVEEFYFASYNKNKTKAPDFSEQFTPADGELPWDN